MNSLTQFMPQSILFFSTIGTLQQHLGEALSAVVSSSPELVAVLHIGEAYLQTIENSIIRDQTGEFISMGFFKISLAGFNSLSTEFHNGYLHFDVKD